jgi:hypothetical protein
MTVNAMASRGVEHSRADCRASDWPEDGGSADFADHADFEGKWTTDFRSPFLKSA